MKSTAVPPVIRLIIVASALLLASPTILFSQIPQTISYQGQIENTDGSPVKDGTHSLTLSLYAAPTGGSPLYSEQQSIQVVDGIFHVRIGSINPFPSSLKFDRSYYLGVLLDDGSAEFTPRTALDASAYSIHSAVADVALGVDPAASGVVTAINSTSGPLTLQGAGSTTVTRNGSVLTISSSGSGGTGIQGVQNTDGSISITNPNGPTATIGIAASGVSTGKIADGAVTVAKLNQNGATTGEVLKWTGTAWAAAIDATGPILPYAQSVSIATDAFTLANNAIGTAISAINSNSGKAGSFKQTSGTASADALYAESNGAGNAIHAVANGTGRSGLFEKGNLEVAGPNATLVLSSTGMQPAAPLIVVPNGITIFRILLNAGNQANAITGPAGVQGQILYIVNDDDDAANLAGTVIAPSQVRQFIFVNGGWRLVS